MMLTMMLTLTMCLPRQLLLPKPLGLLVVMLIAHDVGGDGDRGPAYHVYVDHKGNDDHNKKDGTAPRESSGHQLRGHDREVALPELLEPPLRLRHLPQVGHYKGNLSHLPLVEN